MQAEVAAVPTSSRGLTFEHVMGGDGPVPPTAYFRDPDGNRILLVEETTR
ncbi:MAG: VOC family protein [Mycobacteriaceae bacterium]